MTGKRLLAVLIATVLLTACGQKAVAKQSNTDSKNDTGKTTQQSAATADTAEMFSDRDMLQTPDLTDAVYLTVSDGRDVTIDQEGIYVLSGKAENVTIFVETDDKAKVQLVLKGLDIRNTDMPCIYVKNADKVFVTSLSDDNSLSVSGSFQADGETGWDAVIYSRDDLVFNGTGTISVSSTEHGISGKDDVKITGGVLQISCEGSAIKAHEEILIADGDIEIRKSHDGLHAENSDDNSTGHIYIGGGTINITATDDGIHATANVRIDEGNIVISAAEGIEGTVIRINGGRIDITASDDGINAAHKSSSLNPLVEINGGDVTIAMGAGDTDGVDSNGDITVNGGTISITGQSTFDCDGTATYNGGTIIENGQETNTISNQMMGGRGNRGFMNGQGSMNGQGRMPGAENRGGISHH